MKEFPVFNDYVPERLRFFLLLLFPLVFQMSDAVFMGLSNEIAHAASLRPQDILMCGFSGMVGVTMTFPVLFPLKFRYTTRQLLVTVSLGLALISFLCLQTRNVPVLVVLSFIFGMLKLLGSFTVFSTVMQKVAPRYNFAPFLAMVFIVVFGGIELSVIAQGVFIHYFPWQSVNHASIGLLLLLALFALTCMNDFRPMPMQKLPKIDWIGMTLWGILLLALVYVCEYGGIYNWLESERICAAIGIAMLDLAVIIGRMNILERPFIQFKTFTDRNVVSITLLFLVACVMMATDSVLQGSFLHGVLGFDAYSSRMLKWSILAGVVVGGWFGYKAYEDYGWDIKPLAILSILLLTVYQAYMCLMISPDTALPQLLLPCFCYGAGHCMIFVVLTTYIEGVVPLERRFQALTILGFARIGLGSAAGAALFSHLLTSRMNIHLAHFGSNVRLGSMNWGMGADFSSIAGEVSRQALMVSIKELYALAVMIGVATMLVLCSKSLRINSKY